MSVALAEPRIPRILLVEDNPAHAELVMRCLEREELRADVEHVTDGQRALDRLEGLSPAELPDLVILDLRLPRVSGLAVLERLKADPELMMVPVVVFTSSNAPADVDGAYQRHANSYLVKPIDLEEFNAQVRSLREFWGRWNHPAASIRPRA